MENIVLRDNQIIVSLKYESVFFSQKIKTPSCFYKSLSNSKKTLPNGITNRNWWKNLKPKGFYKYKIGRDITEIDFVLSTDKVINETELISRIYKIGIPKNLEITQKKENITEIKNTLMNREGYEDFGWSNN